MPLRLDDNAVIGDVVVMSLSTMRGYCSVCGGEGMHHGFFAISLIRRVESILPPLV
ncbi:MAG: hypothetical protein ACXWMS_06575 [Syntrophales bacterium]